jgi:hypothetical protein
MEININDELSHNESIEIQKIEQRGFLKRTIKSLLLFLVAALLLTVIGANGDYDLTKEVQTYNVESKEHTITKTYYVNRISLGLGLGVLIVCFNIIFNNYRYVTKALNKKNYLVKFPYKISLKINEEAVFYEDSELKMVWKWKIFENYSISCDYLFLYRNLDLVSSIAVPLKRLTTDEKSVLEKLLKNNISKIKKVNQPPHQNKF